MPPEYKNIAINSHYSWAVQYLTQFSGRYLLTVGLYIAHSHILSCCILYPTDKDQNKRYNNSQVPAKVVHSRLRTQQPNEWQAV